MTELIYGNPGSGKTEYIYTALRDDAAAGKRAFLIVPEQMTVAAEREALLRLPASAQLHIEVLNFSRLANRVFREYGGLTYNSASAGTRKLVMWRTLREVFPMLHLYGQMAGDDRTLADAMLGVHKELKASGITCEMLDRAAAELGSDSLLAKKLSDISLICSTYSTLFGEKFSDTSDDLPRLCEKLDGHSFFAGTNVYIDGFTSFTGQEYEVIRRILSSADKTVITFALPSPKVKEIDTVTCRRCSDKIRDLAARFGGDCRTVYLTEVHRYLNAEMKAVSAGLWSSDTKENSVPATQNVRLFRAADIYDEADDCAARVRRLMEEGYRCRDILIAARDATRYKGILDPALERMGIPFFFSEKTDLSSSAVSRLLLSAFRIFHFGWKKSDVINHLKSGLCGIPTRSADIFECYVSKWNISGKRFLSPEDWKMNPRGYVDNFTPRDEELLCVVNEVRRTLTGRLCAFRDDLNAAATTAELCRATLAYIDSLGVRDALISLSARELEAGHVREAQENARLYDTLTEALDCICDAFDGAPCPDIGTFATALRIILESTEIGTIPTSSDAVTVASADMLRADHPRAVILLGAADGEFPASASDTGLISEKDREMLCEMKIEITGTREERSSEELFFFRRAIASASERAYVYTRADKSPSLGFLRLERMLGIKDDRVENVSYDIRSRICTPESAAEFYALLSDKSEAAAVRDALGAVGRREILREDKNRIPLSAFNDSVDRVASRAAFGHRINISHSRIEQFNKCNFSYYCSYILKLEPWSRVTFTGADVGTFIHFILEKYLREIFTKRGGEFLRGAELNKYIADLVREYVNGSDTKNADDAARRAATIRRLTALSPLVIENERARIASGQFLPEIFELPIGGAGAPPCEFTIPDGEDKGTMIRINGQIDRVDVLRGGDRAYISAIDYKTTASAPKFKDYSLGKNLQLYLYMMTMLKNNRGEFSRMFGRTPTFGALTYRVINTKLKNSSNYYTPDQIRLLMGSDSSASVINGDGNIKNAYGVPPKETNYLSEDAFSAISGEIEGIVIDIARKMCGGAAAARPQDGQTCKHCAYSSVCRAKRTESF